MSRIVNIQTNFTVGEVDPLLRGRIDLNQYYSALKTALNVVILPQGGVRRRPGLKFIFSLPSVASSGVKLIPFEFSTSDSYMFALVDKRIYVFKGGSQVTQITSLTGATYSQTTTTITVTLNSHGLSAGESVYLDFTSGTATDGTYTVVTATTNTFTVTAATATTSGNVTVKPDWIIASTISASILSSIKYAQSADTMIFVNENLEPLKLVRGASDSNWTLSTITFDFIPNYAFTMTLTSPTTTLNPSASTGFIELTCGGGTFTATDNEQYINIKDGYGYGRARIVTYVSTTKVKAQVEIPFSQTSAFASGEWEIERGYEHVWSASRGWPKSVTFHEGRLFFGGSKSRPSTMWGSRVGDVFNFDKQSSNDDDGLEATLDVNQFNAILDIYSGRDLQLFTSGAEFYVPQGLGDPITPVNFTVRVATRNGIISGVSPVGLEAGTIYAQRGGKMIQEFIYTDAQATYVSNKISLLSGHLINTPIDMALRRATNTDESDLLLLVNSAGSITAYSVLRSQDIIAPSQFTTDGLFKAVAIDVNTMYTIVQRTINGGTKYHVEQFNSDYTLDNAVAGGAAASITATNLAAKTVKVIADGIMLGDEVATSGGSITFDRASTTSYQVGQDYTVTIATMPVEPRMASGNIRGFKKRIVEVAAEFYKTQNASISGIEIPFRSFDSSVLDSAVSEFTGLKRVGPVLGYDYEGSVTVTQTAPLKMTLLFLDYRVSVPLPR